MRPVALSLLGLVLTGCMGEESDGPSDAQVDADVAAETDAEAEDAGASCAQICADHLEAQRLRVESELRSRSRSPATCVTPSAVAIDCSADCEAGAQLNQYSYPAVEECWFGTERPSRMCEGAFTLGGGSIARNGEQPDGNGFAFTGTAAVSGQALYSLSITTGAGDTYEIGGSDSSLAGLSVGQVIQVWLRTSCHFWCSARVEISDQAIPSSRSGSDDRQAEQTRATDSPRST